MRICSVEDCGGKFNAKGFCKFHYQRNYTNIPLTSPKKNDGTQGCKAKGCNEKHFAKGYCGFHRARVILNIPFDIPKRHRDGTQGCKVSKCYRKHGSKGYCNEHYKRITAGWSLKELEKPFDLRDPNRGCLFKECNNKHSARGLCKRHYNLVVFNEMNPKPAKDLYEWIRQLRAWSGAVKALVNGLCWCGEKAVQSHHIFGKIKYPKLSLNINNGISLCFDHHMEVHGNKEAFSKHAFTKQTISLGKCPVNVIQLAISSD